MSLNQNRLALEIVSVEAICFSGFAGYVIVPGLEGEIGVYPNHTPLITKIKPGTLRFKNIDSDVEDIFFVAGGILEIQPKIVTVLADTAVRGKDLDEQRALDAKKKAEDLLQSSGDKVTLAVAQSELATAIAELSTISKVRGQK